MSAICGVVALGGDPRAAGMLERLRQPMAHWGSDGGGIRVSDGVAFAQLVAHRTPEAIYERGPIELRGGEVTVTAAGRLDNRAELCREMGLSPSKRQRT